MDNTIKPILVGSVPVAIFLIIYVLAFIYPSFAIIALLCFAAIPVVFLSWVLGNVIIMWYNRKYDDNNQSTQ